LVRVVEEPDLTDFVPGMFRLDGQLGVTVWRGIWYPPENLVGPESLETTRPYERVGQTQAPTNLCEARSVRRALCAPLDRDH
jgi:hypothetical protein